MTPGKLFPESVHQEERVIDGDTDADERDDVGGVDGDIGHVGQPNGHTNGCEHRSNAHPNGEKSGDEGTEHDTEDHQRERPGNEFGLDEVVLDAVVKRPIDRNPVGHPSLKTRGDVNRIVEVIHDGFRFLPVGCERDFVDGVGAVFVHRNHIVTVHLLNFPRIFNLHISMALKFRER